jgi:hypothetical protein
MLKISNIQKTETPKEEENKLHELQSAAIALSVKIGEYISSLNVKDELASEDISVSNLR